MTHRTALALSVALTLILAIGIVAARDRLFEPVANAGPAAVTSDPAVSLNDTVSQPVKPTVNTPGTQPRVIEIPLSSIDRQGSSLFREDQQARDGGDHERDWYDGEHEREGEHDD
jgi:hypothetical protein